MDKTLIVTNDFPPRPGGIQSFVHSMALRLPADRSSSTPRSWKDRRGRRRVRRRAALPRGARPHHDAAADPAGDPPGRRAAARARLRPRCGSAPRPRSACWPRRCARAGARRIVAHHPRPRGRLGAAARRPPAAAPDRRGHRHASPTSASTPARGSPPRSTRGPPRAWSSCRPASTRRPSTPAPAAPAVRARLGLTDRPVVVCVSRLVPRKGQDTLIQAMPAVLRRGAGRRAADRRRRPVPRGTGASWPRTPGSPARSRFTGAVPWAELPAHYGAGDVFAMPCRTRRGGLDVEGLGIVYLEASATGLPVVAGDSGGAPDAVLDGETGYVVPRRLARPTAAERVVALLGDPELRRRLGAARPALGRGRLALGPARRPPAATARRAAVAAVRSRGPRGGEPRRALRTRRSPRPRRRSPAGPRCA